MFEVRNLRFAEQTNYPLTVGVNPLDRIVLNMGLGEAIANDVERTADKVQNKVGDVDVDVDVSRNGDANANAQ